MFVLLGWPHMKLQRWSWSSWSVTSVSSFKTHNTIGLPSSWGWTKHEVPLHLLPTNSEPVSEEISLLFFPIMGWWTEAFISSNGAIIIFCPLPCSLISQKSVMSFYPLIQCNPYLLAVVFITAVFLAFPCSSQNLPCVGSLHIFIIYAAHFSFQITAVISPLITTCMSPNFYFTLLFWKPLGIPLEYFWKLCDRWQILCVGYQIDPDRRNCAEFVVYHFYTPDEAFHYRMCSRTPCCISPALA